ncbi:MAG: hypothetical protein HW416_3367 [Chloroflexi bacterium]|nr:hypothetical protein [Chloroflexota bacterium]
MESTTVIRDRRQIEKAKEMPGASDALPKYGGHGYVPGQQSAATAATESSVAPLTIDGISGAVLDASDLAATRAFYTPIFGDHPGEWKETRSRLVFQTGDQKIEFMKRPRPRTLAHAGQHVAYRVETDRLESLTDVLEASGHPVNWWREDHPAELETTAYVSDPSGNIVQLVASGDMSLLVDHYYVPVEDIEHGELVYIKALRGELECYYGYRTEDVAAARRWHEGKDPAAPWTRNAFISFRTHEPNPTPAAQIFARFGQAYVGVTLTGQRIPEPPEEFLKATPRAILHTSQKPEEVTRYMATVKVSPVSLKYDGGHVPFRREGRNVFLRDRSGNFFQIECAG